MFKVKWTIFRDENFLSTIQLELETKTISSTKGQNWRRKFFVHDSIRIRDENYFVHKGSELETKTFSSTKGCDQNW